MDKNRDGKLSMEEFIEVKPSSFSWNSFPNYPYFREHRKIIPSSDYCSVNQTLNKSLIVFSTESLFMVHASYWLVDIFLVAKCVWGSPDMRRCYHYNPNHKTIHVKVHFVLFRNPSFKYCQCTMNMCHIVVSTALSTLYCLLKELLSHPTDRIFLDPPSRQLGRPQALMTHGMWGSKPD